MNEDSTSRNYINYTCPATLEEKKEVEETHFAYAVKMNDYTNYTSRFSQNDDYGYELKKRSKFMSGRDWSCEFCTFINKAGSTVCLICGAANPYILEANSILNDKSCTDSLIEGSLIDCKDMRGVWYPSKIIRKNGSEILVHFRGWRNEFDELIYTKDPFYESRIADYEMMKNEYPLHKYTIQYYSKDKIEKYLKMMEKKENETIEDKYPMGSNVYIEIHDNDIYEYKVIGINEMERTLDLIHNKEVINSVPVNLVRSEADIDKTAIIHRNKENNELNSITINTSRLAISCDSNVDRATNSMIGDLNKQTVYSNENVKDCGYTTYIF